MTSCGKVITISCKEVKSRLLPAVCAFLNSDGGMIKIIETKQDFRSIEQTIMHIITKSEYSIYVDIKEAEHFEPGFKFLILVKKSKRFITVNYNLCSPSEKQINKVEPTDNIDAIKQILGRSAILEDFIAKDSHLRDFVMNKSCGLKESKVVQLKKLKVEPSNETKKALTFAKRTVTDKNKFSNYVSGFANHRGGHIYFGIDDKGIVTGETLQEKDKADVKKEVVTVIEKMIWTKNKIKPLKGTHWEIYFENVIDEHGEVMNSTYVVVVYVSSFRGGVFITEPESYYFDDEAQKEKKMDFCLWCNSFWRGAFSLHKVSIEPSELGYVTWSSEENRNFFIKLSEKLVDHRDAGDYDGFEKLCKLAETEQFEKRNAGLVVKAGRITIAYKSGDLKQAKLLLNEFEESLTTSKDRLIFHVRFCLSQSLVARREKNYLVCYEKGKVGLQLGQNIPPGLCLLWLYLECAMNATCLGFQNKDNSKKYDEMKQEALIYLENAAKIASTLIQDNIPYRMTDFKHKLSIYKAWVLINYSVTGEAAAIAPNEEDLKAASRELHSVESMERDGKTLTEFRKIEHLLVKCDYFTRKSEVVQNKTEKMKILQSAVLEATAAKALTENKFDNLFEYSKERCVTLEEKLNHCKEKTCGERKFEGLEY
ncbi:uncharacterized protein LOC114533346 [Dendronephthya gigantea]|uniref:uncharacterized protein LOC114533346 n=1 Tax=Dendronephthya gigantea TaxID=151771 RepID=UPI00106ABCCF|nr:uncharacterized protein LOC114533346 [Dendronephthya gigantea]